MNVNRKCVLLRVGIDSVCGGIQGPLFKDGTFEFVCIPDNKRVSLHTYGNILGRDAGQSHQDLRATTSASKRKLRRFSVCSLVRKLAERKMAACEFDQPTTPTVFKPTIFRTSQTETSEQSHQFSSTGMQALALAVKA
jgi:hypothetical protein